MAKGSKQATKGAKPSVNSKKNHGDDDDAVLNAAISEATSSNSKPSLVPESGPGILSSWKAALIIAVISLVVAFIVSQNSNSESHVAPKSDPAAATKKATQKEATKRQKAEQPRKLSSADILKRSKTLPCKDRQDSQFCADMAARGDCDNAVGWMTVMCAAACNRCELLDPKKRCSEENMKIKFDDAYQPGDLDRMFESLVARDDVETEVLSRKPWMVLVKNFISDAEGSSLLRLTEKGLKRSTDQGAIGEDGFQEQVVSQYRTSSNAWCMGDCESHPTVKNLMQRISDLVHVPVMNFESFQVLRYEKTQKYDVHHDSSPLDFTMPAGPRILTFFMYLSDVEEGGETNFPKMNISVKPQKGSALLWPSVESDFPNSKIEQLTYHAALPVKKGTKYAANSWIHLRDYKVGLTKRARPKLTKTTSRHLIYGAALEHLINLCIKSR